MEAKKQSSVEFLFLMLNNPNDNQEFNKRHLDKAKELHKEECRKIYEGMLQNVGTCINQSDLPIFEQYYEANFNK